MKVQRILIPVDFSIHSEKALETGIELAETFGASLVLVHCYPPPTPAIAPYGLALPAGFEGEVRHAAEAHMKEWVEKASAAGVEAECHVTPDPPGVAIRALADELSVDLIVMGTQGRTGIPHVLLGSVAERTIRTAHCPVLVVKTEG